MKYFNLYKDCLINDDNFSFAKNKKQFESKYTENNGEGFNKICMANIDGDYQYFLVSDKQSSCSKRLLNFSCIDDYLKANYPDIKYGRIDKCPIDEYESVLASGIEKDPFIGLIASDFDVDGEDIYGADYLVLDPAFCDQFSYDAIDNIFSAYSYSRVVNVKNTPFKEYLRVDADLSNINCFVIVDIDEEVNNVYMLTLNDGLNCLSSKVSGKDSRVLFCRRQDNLTAFVIFGDINNNIGEECKIIFEKDHVREPFDLFDDGDDLDGLD